MNTSSPSPNLSHLSTRMSLAYGCGPDKKTKVPYGRNEQSVLAYLAYRCIPNPTKTIVGTTNIAHHTKTSRRSVTRALANLKKAGLIERKRRDSEFSVTHETELKWDAIKSRQIKYRAMADDPNPDGHTLTIEEIYTPEELEDHRNAVFVMTRKVFGRHRDFSSDAATARLKKVIYELVKKYGAPAISGVLYCIQHDETEDGQTLKERVSGSNHLGPYIKASLEGWLKKYDTDLHTYWEQNDPDETEEE